MFLMIWLICFIVVVIICKTIVNGIMGFLGADWYTFNVAGRAMTCTLVSLVIAFFIYALING